MKQMDMLIQTITELTRALDNGELSSAEIEQLQNEGETFAEKANKLLEVIKPTTLNESNGQVETTLLIKASSGKSAVHTVSLETFADKLQAKIHEYYLPGFHFSNEDMAEDMMEVLVEMNKEED